MKSIVFIGLLLLGMISPSSIFANEVWILVKRKSANAISYKVNERELVNIEGIVSYLDDKRKQLPSYPPVRVIFDPKCTFDDFCGVSGWLGKIGVRDSKYYLTDEGHYAISEFDLIGDGLLPFPATTAAESGDKSKPSP